MNTPISWIKAYVPDLDCTVQEYVDKMTLSGSHVENAVYLDKNLEKIVVGRIEKIEKHPDADKLVICQVNVGAEEVQIVTGASNVFKGALVPVVLDGGRVAGGHDGSPNPENGIKIKKGKLRGVPSYGMMCSIEELGSTRDMYPESPEDGIYIFDESRGVKPGDDAVAALGLRDAVVEFEITSNRVDCFSMIGMAREAAATFEKPFYAPEVKVVGNDERTKDYISVEVEDTELCPRYTARIVKNIKLAPSPEWMQRRLAAMGIRPINNIVDITNYVMEEYGQPMHAYDLDKIRGHKIVVKRANDGDVYTTLDGQERKLDKDVLMINDAEGPVGIAGIMGGENSMVTDDIQTMLFEAATFDGTNIRLSSKRIGLRTDASGKFEKGLDPENALEAINRACQLVEELGAGEVVGGVVDVYPNPKQANYVTFTPEQINNHLGTNIAKDVMLNIITSVGFDVTKDENDEITVKVPSWRNDVTCMADISEEIARLHGFDKIKSTLPNGVSMQGTQSAKQTFIDKVKASLSSQGLYETISFALTNEETFNKLNIPQDSPLRKAVPIMNPLSDEYPLVRTTLLSSIFDNLARNLARKNDDVALFEVGSVFFPKALPVTELPDEVVKIAGAITGRRNAQGWNQTNDMVDFYDAKGIIEELFANLRVTRYTVEAGTHYAMHPGKTALFKKGRDVIATVGEVHPAVLSAYGITKPVYIFELDATTVMKYMAKDLKYKALPKYPATSRDLAMLVDVDVNAADIEKAMTKAAGQNLTQITLFDVYTGKQVEEGKKSLAFSLTFQSNDKTLTDAEIDPAIEKIVAKLQKDFNANLRG